MSNPLLSGARVPAFEQIKPKHFKKALDQAFDAVTKKYQALRDSEENPTFQNTVVPFDTLFSEISEVFHVLATYALNARSDKIDQLYQETAVRYDDLSKRVYQDAELAARFKVVHDSRDKLNLDAEDEWFLKNQYQAFQSSGAFLDEDQQKRIKEISVELIDVTEKFKKNVRQAGEAESFLITDPEELKGVPENYIAKFKEQAEEKGHKEGWLFVPERLLVDELLGRADNRTFRQKMNQAMINIGSKAPYDNRPIIQKIHALRHEKAELLGYDNYAEYSLDGTMAVSVERVQGILEDSLKYTIPHFENEMDTLQQWVTAQGGPEMEPWDVPYYLQKYKAEKYAFNAQEMAEYFDIENVIDGWIKHAEKSMNVTLTPTDEHETWHKDVRVFKAVDNDTGSEAILYIDLYARPGLKRGGAWKSQAQPADTENGKPLAIVLNMNLNKPAEGKPSLVGIQQLETFYHEGGHSLNGLKGQTPKYHSRRGTGNGSAFVEIHSMIDENWALAPEVLETYAFHHKTGDVIPQDLIDRMNDSSNFMASYETLRLIQNSRRDMEFHSRSADDYVSEADIEQVAALDTKYSDHVRPYPLARFDHLFSDGGSQYAAGYYGYYFADISQAAAFEPFAEHGVYDASLTARKRSFYAAGAGREPNAIYEEFTDGVPAGDPKPLLRRKGIDIPDAANDEPQQVASNGKKPSLDIK